MKILCKVNAYKVKGDHSISKRSPLLFWGKFVNNIPSVLHTFTKNIISCRMDKIEIDNNKHKAYIFRPLNGTIKKLGFYYDSSHMGLNNFLDYMNIESIRYVKRISILFERGDISRGRHKGKIGCRYIC